MSAHDLSRLRRHPAVAQVFAGGRHIIGFIGTERDAAISLAAVKHGERALALGGAGYAGCRLECLADGDLRRGKPTALLHHSDQASFQATVLRSCVR